MATFSSMNGAYLNNREEIISLRPPRCPQCNSQLVWKDGLRYTETGTIQRWLCRTCGYRFSDPKLKHKKMERHIFIRQVCAVRAKNLAEVANKREAGEREATTDVENLLFNFAWWLKKEGYAESTIITRKKLLKILVK